MSNFYLLNDNQRKKLLEGICDQCKNCYRGLTQEEYEKVCSECEPLRIIAGLKPADKDIVISIISFISFEETMKKYKSCYARGELNE